ncbi:fungal specific transcription factor domain-containing protein [Colletotrichum graminicola M1.001]|uniref:Fungal specific transcription factor domain-containing protein n=1 Tax=Colletotrichum graminicola (strain M1.001 / M2 / FGSC 10212) TaxID=645133 RepID=E3QP74_COLGM|nr:fungal specific transcription factor domain-containing protein [Colletotrichum graminicola M1.001]EFQ32662.1 fungal specific transcription factor domain-containing protein [Colletotrichum graminicola M1.001]
MSSYITELESRVQYLESIVKHERPDLSLDTEALRQYYYANLADSPGSTNEAKFQAVSNVCSEDCELEPRDHHTAHYSGEFSYWAFSMKVKRHAQARGFANKSPRSDMVPSRWRPLRQQQSAQVIRTAIAKLPPRFVASYLSRVFFAYAQKNFFFVEKEWFDITYQDPGDPRVLDASKMCIIFAVLATATQYAHMDSPSSSSKRPSGEGDVGNSFYERALRLLPEVIQSASLESVQAVAILGFYAQPLDGPGLSYVYFSLATRLAIQNGVHRRYSGRKMPPVTIETRNRVWWTVYSIEKSIAIFHGRPPSILRSDVDADLPRIAPDVIPDDGPLHIGRMVIWIKLIEYLGIFLEQILALRKKSPTADAGLAVFQLAAMKAEMKAYWDTIPCETFDEDSINNRQAARSSVHLRLLYCLIRMSGNTAIIQPSGSGVSPAQAEPYEMTDDGSGIMSASEHSLVEDSIDAAREAVALCWGLYKGEDGLSKGSFIEHNSCRASLLVLIAYSIQNRDATFRSLVQQGLQMVRHLSDMCDLAREETSLLEDLNEALTYLVPFEATNGEPDHELSRHISGGKLCRNG